jgi:hypothetical protein
MAAAYFAIVVESCCSAPACDDTPASPKATLAVTAFMIIDISLLRSSLYG